MDEEARKAFLEYEELKLSSKEIEKRLAELKPIITQNVREGEVVDGRSGSFVMIRKIQGWNYSPSILKAEEELNSLKEREVGDGTATPKEITYVEYRVKKN